MDYLKEEIAFVEFCIEKFPCDQARYSCPIVDTCDAQYDEKNSERTLCRGILQRMKEGEELSEVERKVIQFFSDDKTGIWSSCKLKKENRRCINWRICDINEKKGQKNVCDELLGKLGLLLPDESILERAIESIICRDQKLIEWEVGEDDLVFYARQPSAGNIGRPDILFGGSKSGTLYVIELKVGMCTREHVGQLASYVGWYKMQNEFKGVKGILVAEDFHEGAKCAIGVCPDIEPRLYKLNIKMKKPTQETSRKV
jgi:hypothetical protein